MTAILLLAGCLLAGLTIARAANMHDMTREEAEASERGNWAAFLVFLLVAAMGGCAVFGGATP